MTERHVHDVVAQNQTLHIGPSALSYSELGQGKGRLTINVNEFTAPLPRRVQGRIQLDLQLQNTERFNLDRHAHHQWWPAAPNSRIKVDLNQPGTHWQGNAYADMNWGARPIENDLRYWCWSRFRRANGTLIHYDIFNTLSASTDKTDTPDKSISIFVDDAGNVEHTQPPAMHTLPRSGWRMPRHARGDDSPPEIITAMEDTPFYTRSAIRSHINGEPLIGINESVSLTRFKHPVVQTMLRFRMPRLRWQTQQ